MKLAMPPAVYSPTHEIERNRQIEREDSLNRKKGRDVDVGSDRLILKSPNGTRWVISVNNSGAISATAL